MKQYKLYIFDADSTLCDKETGNLLHNVRKVIGNLPPSAKIAIVTNQDGVGLRYWMEREDYGNPDDYPTERIVRQKYREVAREIGASYLYLAFSYQSNTGEWGPTPDGAWQEREWFRGQRLPNAGMLIQAMDDMEVSRENAVMIGDSHKSAKAAQTAGIAFIHTDLFFGARES